MSRDSPYGSAGTLNRGVSRLVRRRFPRSPGVYIAAVGLGCFVPGIAAFSLLKDRADDDNDEDAPRLHPVDFSDWVITARQTVSSTNKVFVLDPDPPKRPRRQRREDASSTQTDPYRKLWRDGTWSVTVVQPQLQVARQYTPLPPWPPPFYGDDDDDEEHQGPSPYADDRPPPDDDDDGQPPSSSSSPATLTASVVARRRRRRQDRLRFLIRRDGETSSYIHDRPLGATLGLRGPARQLTRLEIGPGRVDDILFIAGGTGVVPAMQLAHGLLWRRAHRPDGDEAQDGVGGVTSPPPPPPPTRPADHDDASPGAGPGIMNPPPHPDDDETTTRITILWANRRREECPGAVSDPSLTPPLQQPQQQQANPYPAFLSALKSLFFVSPPTPQVEPPPSSSPPPQTAPAPAPAPAPQPPRSSSPSPIVTHLNALRHSFHLVATGRSAGTPTAASPSTTTTTTNPTTTAREEADGSLSPPPPQPPGHDTAAEATGPRLEIGYFVDEEGSVISPGLLRHLLLRPRLVEGATTGPRRGQGHGHDPGHGHGGGQGHGHGQGPGQGGRRLVIVSGPDGFVEYFAGRRLVRGRDVVQGLTGGVLARLSAEGALDGWEVWKL